MCNLANNWTSSCVKSQDTLILSVAAWHHVTIDTPLYLEFIVVGFDI